MIPNSIGTAIAFLLFIAPGAIWQWWRSRYRTSAKETLVTESAQLVLISIVASLIAALISWALGTLTPIIEALNTSDLPQEGGFKYYSVGILSAIMINSVIACILTFSIAIARWHGQAVVAPINVWGRAFTEFGTGPRLIVKQQDGTVWHGRYAAYDHDIDASEVNLLIREPIKRKRASDTSFERKHRTTFVILPSRTIDSIQVFFPDVENQE